jgi:outer membrane protein assembly factor BamD
MTKKWLIIWSVILLSLSFNACSEYNRVLKSTDLEYKFNKANEYYEKGDYYKAYPLIQELTAIYRGQRRSEKLFYMFAYSDYHMGDYLLGSHRFSEFTKTFPTSQYTQECAFMSAFCLYKLSPPDKLDQTNTYSAISSLQAFIDRYPHSERVDSCNTLIVGLERKIEDKVFKGAVQYQKMENFTSAVLTYENILKDFPDTKYREDIFFNIYDSYYTLALKSVTQKKSERINKAFKAYVNFADRFPGSDYMDNAQVMYARLEKIQKKLEK